MAKKALVILWLVVAVAWLGAAASGTGRLKNYDIWKDLPSKQLMQMGHRFYDVGKADSALLCYNIVVNRYHSGDKHNSTSPRQACSALNQLGILYTHFFIDHAKANRYLLEAQKIAKENHFQKHILQEFGCDLSFFLVQQAFCRFCNLQFLEVLLIVVYLLR